MGLRNKHSHTQGTVYVHHAVLAKAPKSVGTTGRKKQQIIKQVVVI